MRFAVRADASGTIGTGHLIRCLTLADALKAQGHEVMFLCRSLTEFTRSRIVAGGHELRLLSSGRTAADVHLAHGAWLGCSQLEDVDQSRLACSGMSIDWLLVDHYGIDRTWEQEARGFASRIMVIDDLADRYHDCDILLDQNLIDGWQSRYDGLVPESSTVLLGPRYALLQSAYAEFAARERKPGPQIGRILVSFGAADRWNLALAAVREARDVFPDEVAIDVVLSSSQQDVAVSCRSLANVHIHTDLPSLAGLMSSADLAVGAAGATSWERICLRVPSLVVVLAENQAPIASALQDNGLALCLGHADTVVPQTFRDAFLKMREPDPTAWFNMDLAAQIDGSGTARIVEALHERSASPIS